MSLAINTQTLKRRGRLSAVWWATFSLWCGIHVHALIMPLYLEGLGFKELTIGLVVGLLSLAAVVGRISTGWLLDYSGTITILLVGSILWAAFTPAIALLSGLVPIVALTVIHGWGVGGFNNAALSAVTGFAVPHKRASAITNWETANKLANIFGPLAASAVLFVGFKLAFALSGIAAVLSAVFVLFLFPARGALSRPADARPPFTLSSLLVATVWRQSAIGGVLGVAIGGFTTFAPILAIRVGFQNPGGYVVSYAIAIVTTQLLFARFADRVRRDLIIVPALVLAAVGALLVPFVPMGSSALLVPIIFGIGVGLLIPSLIAWVVETAGDENKNSATSTFFTYYELGRFVGAVGIGLVIQLVGLVGFVISAALLSTMIVFFWCSTSNVAGGKFER